MKMQLYYNGNIHTFSSTGRVDWLLCGAGKILAAGQKNNRPANHNQIINSVDIKGKTVFPAFSDAHTHFVATALGLGRINLERATSLAEALGMIKERRSEFSADEWIRGGGFNKNIWRDGQPHKKCLDKIFPHNPVALESKDFHAFWINSRALDIAGISRQTKDPPGGKIARDANGEPTGLLYEKALNLVYDKIALPSTKKISASVKQLTSKFLSLGITSVHTMEGLAELKALQQMQQNGDLKLRIQFFIPKDQARVLVHAGVRSGFGSDWLNIAGVKFFTDGSLGSQTAHMLKPYEGTDNTGIPHISERELQQDILYFNQNGLSAAVHAIGDAALIKTLNAFEFAQKNEKFPFIQNRIEHAQLVPQNQIERLTRLNLIASMQPLHIADDVDIAEKYWGARCAQAYPFKQLQEAGVTLAFGSDTPVADFNPFKGVFSAVARKYALNPELESWYPQQAVSVRQALLAYTQGAAKAAGRESVAGSLEPGKVADFILIDRDILSIPVDELLEARVLKTILAGTVVYEALS